MITKLKGECGQQYTSKLEGMYRDIQTSDDLMEQYRLYREEEEEEESPQQDAHTNQSVSQASLSFTCMYTYQSIYL